MRSKLHIRTSMDSQHNFHNNLYFFRLSKINIKRVFTEIFIFESTSLFTSGEFYEQMYCLSYNLLFINCTNENHYVIEKITVSMLIGYT